MYEFCQKIGDRKCRLEVEVNFQHWVPYPTPYIVRLECENGPVTLRTTGEGVTLEEALQMAQERICGVLEAKADKPHKRRSPYTVDHGAECTSGAGASTRGMDTASSYKEDSTLARCPQ